MRSLMYAMAGQQQLAYADTHTDTDTDQLSVFDALADTETPTPYRDGITHRITMQAITGCSCECHLAGRTWCSYNGGCGCHA